ncbi:methyltransferase domain-containing protein [Saccharopolyspora rhizosphaerae]|uniref:Methyltransferase domain-containing protein n=1 Tax=Saccharopolyspora rhizosphaerae TaxID=2492662 RepID=A0A426JU69_9PSEU|nr:HemK2/MTQ2 family protein methyltransferase [Saccharopolyspora rhizosphaerae]RRO16732.1 methyltransferase domain-containing protein [Saccharopolyspora rhizosphaerae]
MRLLRTSAVYRPQGDTWLLARALGDAGIKPGSRVLDVGTGTGFLALTAARAGAREVTAVDVSLSAVVVAGVNAWLRRLPVRVQPGDALECDFGEPFDLVLANPPYVPCDGTRPPRGAARAWDAGPDGRAVIERLCARVPELLASRGTFLMVQSDLADADATLVRLREEGLKAAVVERQQQAFGPVLEQRAAVLEERGLIQPGQRWEELVVIRADRPR